MMHDKFTATIQTHKILIIVAEDYTESIAYVVDLCQKIFTKTPEAYVLHIKAYEFDFIEELTLKAAENILEAFDFLRDFVKKVS